MNESLFSHPYFKKAVIASVMFLGLFLLAKTAGEVQGFKYIGNDKPAQSTITVSGKGEVLAIPDIANFSFSVTEESLVVSEAQERAAKKSNAILAFLDKNGVDKKDVKATGYNIYPRYEYERSTAGAEYYPYPILGKQRLVAYVVTESLSVKVRKVNDAGKLLSGVGDLGATNVSGLAFSVDKEDDLVKVAREKAIADARDQAKSLAGALGVRLVRIVNFSEGGNYPMPMYFKGAALEAADGRGGTVAPEVPAGETKITSNISITYEIR